jgi:hypothetical protein
VLFAINNRLSLRLHLEVGALAHSIINGRVHKIVVMALFRKRDFLAVLKKSGLCVG